MQIDPSISQPFKFNLLQVVCIMSLAVLTSSISQFINWVLLYRRQSYKQNTTEVVKLNKKLQKLKNAFVLQTHIKAQEKKISAVETQLKSLNQQMMIDSMKCNLAIGLIMIGAINIIGTYFQGKVVAILPFEPYFLFQAITHRNLAGEDYTQCAYLFFYVLTAFIFRGNLKKALGFEQPKSAVSYFDPPKYKPQ